jgi:ribonucleoside-diphosphate reductase alpha chain
MTGANVDKYGNYTSNLTLYNCYVIPSPKDSRKSIVQDTLFQLTEVMSRGGGVGVSLSTLRPRYAYVRGVHGKSSGSVSWGGLYSYTTGLIEQGGSRRGALMLMQADWHPDVLEFIESKTKSGMIENANISIMISDRFMETLKADKFWDLEFPDYEHPAYNEIYNREWDGDLQGWKDKGYPVKVYKSIRARELWDKLIGSAWASAEPGVVFIERYNKLSNSYYYNKIVCTNPCGEQGLPPWGVCNLGHLYLASFAETIGKDKDGPLYTMNWDALKKSARILTRFLDNVIDVTPYHFEENKTNQTGERRIGAGTLGLGELLIKLRLKYGSEQSLKFIDKIYRTICVEIYKESSMIAAEKGPFPKFDSEKFLKSGYRHNPGADRNSRDNAGNLHRNRAILCIRVFQAVKAGIPQSYDTFGAKISDRKRKASKLLCQRHGPYTFRTYKSSGSSSEMDRFFNKQDSQCTCRLFTKTDRRALHKGLRLRMQGGNHLQRCQQVRASAVNLC